MASLLTLLNHVVSYFTKPDEVNNEMNNDNMLQETEHEMSGNISEITDDEAVWYDEEDPCKYLCSTCDWYVTIDQFNFECGKCNNCCSLT
jgi:hypothetical protein